MIFYTLDPLATPDDLVLEEMPSDQLEIWDELDNLTIRNTKDFQNQASQQVTNKTVVNKPVGVSPSNRSALKSNNDSNTNQLQPTSAFNAPQSGGLKPTSDFSNNSGGGLQPTSAFNQNSTGQGTLRSAPNQQVNQQQQGQGQISTLRQPASVNNQMGSNDNQNQMGMNTMYGNQMGMQGQMYDPNQMGMNTMYGNQMGMYGNQMGMPGQMGMNTMNTMYGNQMGMPGQMGMNTMNTMYGNQMGMYDNQMGMNTNNTMYGNQMMGMQGQMGMNPNNQMYGNQMGINQAQSVYGNQMGQQQPLGINTNNSVGSNNSKMNTTRGGNYVRATMNATPSEFTNTPSLQSNAMVGKSSSREMMNQLTGRKDTNAETYTWEFFHAAGNNNVKRLNELLELGVDVNQIDTDTGNTALHMACTKGQKHAIFFLVDQGADVSKIQLFFFTFYKFVLTHYIFSFFFFFFFL